MGLPLQQVVAGEIERGPDRGDLLVRSRACPRRDFGAENDPGVEAVFHFAREDRGQHPALSDQLGLSLVNKLVVIEAEEEKSTRGSAATEASTAKMTRPSDGRHFSFLSWI